MKLNMICIKFYQKVKKNLKNLNFGLFRFFSKPFSSLVLKRYAELQIGNFCLTATPLAPSSEYDDFIIVTTLHCICFGILDESGTLISGN